MIYLYLVTNYLPLKIFFKLWFPNKGSEISQLRESNQMNFNTRDIVVVHIGFRFLIIYDFTSEGSS